MYMSTKQGSAIAFDMGLEKGYNKPAQTVHGIIGYTLRSEAVALWNVLKHEKDAYVRNLKEMCYLTDHDDEFSLHHEFNQKSARRSHERVCLLKKYIILTIRKPFNQNKQFCNLVTKVEIHQSTTEKLLDCMSFGDDGYNNYVQSRLVDKDTPLQAPIPANRSYFEGVSEPPKKKAKVLDNDNSTEALVRYIDYTKERGYDTKQLLEFELSDSPLYLVNENIKKEGLLTKSAKAQLANELVKKTVCC